jgi:hypothetical protein
MDTYGDAQRIREGFRNLADSGDYSFGWQPQTPEQPQAETESQPDEIVPELLHYRAVMSMPQFAGHVRMSPDGKEIHVSDHLKEAFEQQVSYVALTQRRIAEEKAKEVAHTDEHIDSRIQRALAQERERLAQEAREAELEALRNGGRTERDVLNGVGEEDESSTDAQEKRRRFSRPLAALIMVGCGVVGVAAENVYEAAHSGKHVSSAQIADAALAGFMDEFKILP